MVILGEGWAGHSGGPGLTDGADQIGGRRFEDAARVRTPDDLEGARFGRYQQHPGRDVAKVAQYLGGGRQRGIPPALQVRREEVLSGGREGSYQGC